MSEGANPVIDHDESYRLAKRNVLFWSALTILIAVGTADSANPITIGAVVANLSYSQTFLTAAALVVLAFTVLGYIRADLRLKANHSGFAFGKKLKELSEVAALAIRENEKSISEARMLRRDIDHAREKIGHIFNEAEHKRVVLPNQLSKIKEDVSTEITELEKDNRAKDMELAVFGKLEHLPTQLTQFSDRIGAGERRWFWLYDRGVVALVVFAATISAIWHLLAPESLAELVGLL